MAKLVYTFGGGGADGSAGMKNLLGGKGANLAEMATLGLPVPPGFTITTEVCVAYYAQGKQMPAELAAEIDRGLDHIGRIAGRTFGDSRNPLLLSVRSGARASMPGMMDTVLNLGLTNATVEALAEQSGDARFARDSYRRFIQMYSDVVLGIDHDAFEEILQGYKDERGYSLDTDLDADDWHNVVVKFLALVEDELGEPFPQDPHVQLAGAVEAVLKSWMNARAIAYRTLHDIPASWGTAVSVQAMVFGNMGETSATGVAFSRDPSTGERALYGEFLINAQGEDVVAGIRTPQDLTEAARIRAGSDAPSMETTMPEVFGEFVGICDRLEAHYRDMQDVEFTIERGKLWMLQCRIGKRTTQAALKIAVDMAGEGLISEAEAVARIDPAGLDQLLHPTIDPDAPKDLMTTGLPASPGAACGSLVFSAEEAVAAAQAGKDVILARVETSPDDILGMHSAKGVLTTRGGMTSHAAVVARGMGRPCVSGAGSIRIDAEAGTLAVGNRKLGRGDIVTIDGSTGAVYAGVIAMREPELSGDFSKLMTWADGARRMKVRANADTPSDARTARGFGAEGIGLCRTEHMFFQAERILAVREMILAGDEAGRRAALAKLLPMQRADFVALFEIMHGLPVTIRLLDPPLHEFLPHRDDEIDEMAVATGIDRAKIVERVGELSEFNPMLGHRGVRLAVSYPEIAEMQARAIFEAAAAAMASSGDAVVPEIMVPLVALTGEFDLIKAVIDRVAGEVAAETGTTIAYQVGTMIELPRAALRAGDIARTAEFFSFGTNDLTQTTFGLSRDDSARFLADYVRSGVMETDPFVTLDQEGVGELVRIGTERGRATRPALKVGICGEHGGDPASIGFCETVGLDYVSCSPFRVPIARLAAAQAALRAGQAG